VKQEHDDDGERGDEHADDARGLARAGVSACEEEGQEADPDDDERHDERAARAARLARSVQVPQAHEAFELEREQLAEAEQEQQRERRGAEGLAGGRAHDGARRRRDGSDDESEAREPTTHGTREANTKGRDGWAAVVPDAGSPLP
jgi:hypothetical protein